MEGYSRDGMEYGQHHSKCRGTLFAAAMSGDLLRVERALRLDSSAPTHADEFGSTALHLASRYGHLDIILTLLSRGSTLVNATDDGARTPAHLAAEGGHTSVLEALGRSNANMNKPDAEDRVPLSIVVGSLAGSGADSGGGSSMALTRTSSKGESLTRTTTTSNLEMKSAQAIVSQGGVVDRVDKQGRSGLHNAVASASVAQLELWLELGANVDKPVVDSTRATPLFLAASEIADEDYCVTVVRMLLDAGAHPDKPGNRAGQSVVQALVDKGVFVAAAACVRAGGDHRNVQGVTAEQQADFKALASEFASEQRKAQVKRYAGRAAAAVVGYVEEQQVEPTIVRRNYLLTMQNGNVDEALAMVSFRGLLTDHLPNLTASVIPAVGTAYGVIEP